MEYITIKTEVTSSKRTKEQTQYSSTVYALPIKIDESGIDDAETIFKLCRDLQTEIGKRQTERIKITSVGDHKTDYIRKCVEFALQKTKCQAILTTNTSRAQ